MYRAERVGNGKMIEGWYVEAEWETTGGDFASDSVKCCILPEGSHIEGVFYEIIPATLEIKLGKFWFKVDEVDDKITRLIKHTKWMLKEMDYRNTQTGIDSSDSPEVKDLRELLEELE